jgi:hypothetical protein
MASDGMWRMLNAKPMCALPVAKRGDEGEVLESDFCLVGGVVLFDVQGAQDGTLRGGV